MSYRQSFKTLQNLVNSAPKWSTSRLYSLWRPPWRCGPQVPSTFQDAVERMDREFRRMEREFDRFFDHRPTFWRRFDHDLSPALKMEKDYAENPIVEENGKFKFKLVFDVSRFKPEEINVKTSGKALTVEAKHSSKDKNYESKFEYFRQFLLPDGTDVKAMTCNYNEDGSLIVEAPYEPAAIGDKASSKSQTIEIKHE
uniref:SHSP domain-containing protein n=1 Tax=Romanomermis culicivorax TaxID=13658 RepID=A0A915IAS1_ROMCU